MSLFLSRMARVQEPEPPPPPVEEGRIRSRFEGLRSTLGVALLPCALAATVVWLALLAWGAVMLVDLPFR